MFTGITIKLILAVLLGIVGIAMLFPEKEVVKESIPGRFGYWNILDKDNRYVINLFLAVPLTLATGFFSGMVGISRGSFFVSLLVVGCGVPMRIAVGIATAMLAAR
ncbi:MAG: TSUP family transporter [Leptolinea sp.]|nr:TSUP family transporter [Leptolinea sp.]